VPESPDLVFNPTEIVPTRTPRNSRGRFVILGTGLYGATVTFVSKGKGGDTRDPSDITYSQCTDVDWIAGYAPQWPKSELVDVCVRSPVGQRQCLSLTFD
jgi:hypothetical protein